MKKTLTLVGLGACVLLAFPSCKSTDGDGFYDDTEEALPMSLVGDNESAPWEDEIPGWLENDYSNGAQVSAGETTIIPAPDEPVADNGGRVSTSQNQPKVAVNDEIIVDDGGIDPLSGTPISTPTTPSTPTPKPAASTPKTGKSGSSAGKTGTGKTAKKPVKKVSKPTLIGYKVKKGDSLSTIAKRSNTTVAQIRRDSNIKGDIIHPGQTIWVRYTPKGYKAPAASSNKSNKNGKKNNATTSGKGGKTYTVRSGETISGIAKKHGVSTASLLKANGMTGADAAKMRPGKKLVIPKS